MADLLPIVRSLLDASLLALSPREVLEAIWIGAQLAPEPQPTSASVGEEPSESGDNEEDDPEEDEEEDEGEDDDELDAQDYGAEIALPHGETRARGWRPRGVMVPQPPPRAVSVADRAGIAGLALRRPHPYRQELDLPRTIAWSCRAGEPVMAMSPEWVASTHVVLLVDHGPTMSPWSGEATHLERLVRTVSGMKRCTVLSLDLGSTPVCRSASGDRIDLTTVLGGGDDNLVLLWTDGVSEERVMEKDETQEIACPRCRSVMEESNRVDFVEDTTAMAESMGTGIEIVSEASEEGDMLKRAFGGVAGILRYRINT